MKTLLSIFVLAAMTVSQEKAVMIPKKELPKEAECSVCVANGSPMGMEKPAAGAMYKGKPYYFCNVKEVGEFMKNPEMYVPLELPMPLPEFSLKDTSGKLWNSEAFKGKLVMLDYWATWCKPCLALKPKIDKIRDAYKSQGFEVLSVSIDEKQATLDKFLAKAKWDNPVALDTNKTWANLHIVSIPALFLVKDGKVVAVFRGNADPKAVDAAVKANL
ncbi:MAG: redoxin family protein [Armatimonadota bacterium]